jgi:large subunit ribosomal protein L28
VSRRCQITNKGPLKGNSVSHANNKRRKTWNANVKTKRVFDSETGTWVKLHISARALRTISKKGLAATLKDAGLLA